MDEHLSGKVAIVTGGTSGIGKACVAALARAGVRVVNADLNVANAAGPNDQIVSIQTDVNHPDQCSRLVEQASQHFGRLDILINCAGIFADKPALEMDASLWRHVFDVNVHGVYFCSQAFARKLVNRQTPGVIVNISSTASIKNAVGVAAYCTSKAAVNHLTRALALEWASQNIRVNAIAPSHVNTPRIRQVAEQGHLDLETIIDRLPLGRLAEPDEIADAVLFMCSDQSRFVTGQILFVDGGFSVNTSWKK